MLRYHSYNIVFQEVPNEVTLAINLSNCPNGCKGCHSPYLQKNIGEELNEQTIDLLLEKYGDAITCVCFMGGDADPRMVEQLALHVRKTIKYKLKTAWYSGKSEFSKLCSINSFDYLKLGPYVESLGGLDVSTTNQRFYRNENGQLIDETYRFQKKPKRHLQ